MKLSIHPKLFLLLFLLPFLSCDSEEEPEKPQLPEVVTLTEETEAAITHTSVEISGSIPESDDGISAYGVVWAQDPNPTLENNVVLPQENFSTKTKKNFSKQSESTFTVEISGLVPGNTYYFRTFATNEAGTAYGEELSLATPGLGGTTWEVTFLHREDLSWIAHVEFFEDGTAFYTEPEYPGTYDEWGEWSMEGNVLTYDIMPESGNDSYILTGEVQKKEMSGTYTFNTNEGMTERSWEAIQLPSNSE